MSSIWSSSSSLYLENRIMPCPSESSIHPHPLGREKYVREKPYTCEGCKEIGLGKVCECDHYYLHPKCYELSFLTGSSSIGLGIGFRKSRKCNFVFQKEGGGAGGGRGCDACGMEVKGWSYRCKVCNEAHYLHPCCANLPLNLEGEDDKGVVLLRLEPKASSKCQECNRSDVAAALGIRGWFYLSESYCYHVGCVKRMALQKPLMNANPPPAADAAVAHHHQYGIVKETTTTAAATHDDHEKNSTTRTNQSSWAITKRRSGTTIKVLKQATKIILSLIISAILGIPVNDACVAVFNRLF